MTRKGRNKNKKGNSKQQGNSQSGAATGKDAKETSSASAKTAVDDDAMVPQSKQQAAIKGGTTQQGTSESEVSLKTSENTRARTDKDGKQTSSASARTVVDEDAEIKGGTTQQGTSESEVSLKTSENTRAKTDKGDEDQDDMSKMNKGRENIRDGKQTSSASARTVVHEDTDFKGVLFFGFLTNKSSCKIFNSIIDAKQGSSASERTGDDAKIQQSKEAAPKREKDRGHGIDISNRHEQPGNMPASETQEDTTKQEVGRKTGKSIGLGQASSIGRGRARGQFTSNKQTVVGRMSGEGYTDTACKKDYTTPEPSADSYANVSTKRKKQTNGHDNSKQTRYSVGRKAQESEIWKEEKEKYLKMGKEEKRKYCRSYVVLNDVPTWTEYYKKHKKRLPEVDGNVDKCDVDEELNNKVSIWRGDITTLEIDCIVNAANESLLGGGGVDGAIHRAAGSNLVQECRTLHGCRTGDAKITGGYKLPAKYIIHTVGPIGSGDKLLQSCYKTSLEIMTKNDLHSIAFPCISTGIYGFPADRAANIALDVARTYLEKNRDKVERIVFCLFMEHDVRLYEQLMQIYFPIGKQPESSETSKRDDLAAQTDKAFTEIPEKIAEHSGSKNKSSEKQADTQTTADKDDKQVNSSEK